MDSNLYAEIGPSRLNDIYEDTINKDDSIPNEIHELEVNIPEEISDTSRNDQIDKIDL